MDESTARKLLADERQKLEKEIERLNEAVGRAAERAAEPQDRGDSSSIDYDQAKDMARAEELGRDLEAITRAEKRLEDGTYGLSIESGEPIGDGRLTRLPASERTTEEQREFERRGG